jgi:sterol desaturase/sphingolipid hydroxylase (fatty acid hydroxylase superfamily)
MRYVGHYTLLVWAILIAAALAEGAIRTVRGRGEDYDWRAFAVSLLDMFLRIAILVVVPFTILSPVTHFVARHALPPVPMRSGGAFAALFLGHEFVYYAYHLGAHRIRWFWANHVVHHAPAQLNLAVGLRNGTVGNLIGYGIFYLPLIGAGFSFVAIDAMLTACLAYQFFLHSPCLPKLGPLEGWLNTPSAHRVHHAKNPEYVDANFGGVLLVFDRLFGTYRAERDDIPCRYGVAGLADSHNPFRVELGPWRELAKDIAAQRSPRGLARALLGPPR